MLLSARMNPEKQYEYPHPPKNAVEEMALGTVLRHLVDELFTYQPVAEKLRGLEAGDALPALVETWKQGLTQHLEETVHHSVGNVVAILDLLQSGEPTPLTATEQQEWRRIATWYQPFNVASITREELRGLLPDEAIANLTDDEMQQIANRMSDAYRDNSYWENLSDATQLVTSRSPESPTPTRHSE
jgi:hypothetical protein